MRPAWLIAFALPLLAQEARTPVFQSESALALVPFQVKRKHRYADDLKAEDVILLEDGKPRKFTVFEGGGRSIPIEMALLFDTSGSVNDAGLLDPLEYQSALLDRLSGVRLSVYTFNDSLFRQCAPTRDAAELAAALGRVKGSRSGAAGPGGKIPLELPRGRKGGPATWLFESIIATARNAAAEARVATRMLVVFSDGFPTTSTRPEEAAAVLSELGVPAYPVILGHANIAARKADGQLGWPQMAELFMADFARLAELTGGRSFDPPALNVTIVRQILDTMAAQAQGEYVVGFAPEPSPGGQRKHRLEVRLRSRELGTVHGGVRTLTH